MTLEEIVATMSASEREEVMELLKQGHIGRNGLIVYHGLKAELPRDLCQQDIEPCAGIQDHISRPSK